MDKAKIELRRDPVSTEVSHVLDMSEGDDMHLTVLVPHAQRPYRHALDRPFELPGIDIFADAKGVVRHEKNAGHDVAHQRLRAEADREPEDRGAGDERRGVN